ncbi:MAG: phosphoglycerate kinase [Flammeovirgaceae bacterium]
MFDKGPKTVELFDKVVQRANSIFWNGPIGVF